MGFKVSAKIEGLEELVKQLRDELPRRMQSKILKKAIGDGSKLILKSAKQKVAKGETGLLKRSLGRRIKVYRMTGKVVAIVGPRTGFKKTKAGRVRTKLGEQFRAAGVDPVKYAHLVEKGRKSVEVKEKKVLSDGTTFFGTKVQAAPPRPFLRPALDENLAAIKQIFITTIKDGLEKNRIGTVESEGTKSD